MTPWLRTLRTYGILLALAAPTLAASPHGTTPSYDGIPYVTRPAPEASRAGSPAGEGRERPGRRESTPPDETAYEETAPAPRPPPCRTGHRNTDALPDSISDRSCGYCPSAAA